MSVTKYLMKQLNEKLILANSFQEIGPWLLDPLHLGRTSWQQECVQRRSSPLGGEGAERDWIGLGTKQNLQKYASSDLFPTAKYHLLNFPEPPKIAHYPGFNT